MSGGQRIFVDAIERYCAARGIAVEVRSQGWLIVMQCGPRRHFALGYDIGLNSAIAHRIANDKSATSDVLAISGVACVPHTIFLNPSLTQDGGKRSWAEILGLSQKYPDGLVVKPNEGTSGKLVFHATTAPALELAVARVFAAAPSLCISPYLDIKDEVRVVLIDDNPAVVYSKQRATVTGDGKRSLRELALAGLPADQGSAVLASMIETFGKAELDAIVPHGKQRLLNWRHNLDAGARPVLLDHGEVRDACVRLAASAARAIGIRFASVDAVRVGSEWKILEVNSGVMMEALGRAHPDLVHAIYSTALDKVFASS
jgi:glutathione synthase/RimK-type ligase-like ATP-grasp enzyme